jgi:hypothetical protein
MVAWTPATKGAHAKQFLVQRDGRQVGIVAAPAASYLDKGLQPGAKHAYTVVAQAGSHRSAVSAAMTATTTTPAVEGLKAGAATGTTLTFSWSPPPGSPTPTTYTVFRDDQPLDAALNLPGTVTQYKDTGLTPGTKYTYKVYAYWGSAMSDTSADLVMSTKTLAVSAARLTGSIPIDFKVTSGTGNLKTGLTWTNTWSFAPKCASGACDVVVSGEVTPAGYTVSTFTATLTRNGAGYSGSTTAHITQCGVAPNVVDVQNGVNVQITVRAGTMSGDSWNADSLTGTMTVSSPYTTAGSYYCPAQSFTTSFSASGATT